MKNKQWILAFGFPARHRFTLLLAGGWLSASGVFAQTPNFSYTQTCFGNQTTLVASSALPDTSIASWKWDLDGNGSYDISGKTIISLLTINDTIAVKLKITPKSGTADSITKNVIIDPLPQVNFFASNLCQGKTATYISQSMIAPGSITQYKWDFDNNGVDDAVGDTATYVCGPAQTYVTKLTCVSAKGCAAFSQKVTTVYPNPGAAFTVANTCVGSNTSFTNTTTAVSPDYYSWNFGDGYTNVSSGNINHTYALPGSYNIGLVAVTQAGCRDTIINPITINPAPPAVFQFSGDTSFFNGQSVTITVVGGSFTYFWSTLEVTDNITITQGGGYGCIVTDANGCTTNLTTEITVTDVPDTIAVAGAILTPNDDNINDALMIENVSAYQNCDLKIYSMWNDEVFSVKGYKNDWKGTNKSGGNLPAGAYYYMIKCDDKTMLKGNINILR